MNSNFTLDIRGITLASFILGVLGVVDDAAVSQVATVGELKKTNVEIKHSELFKSAMRVGSSHIGSLMNTLFLAYVASALTLMILLTNADQSLIDILNSDLFAEEIIRTIVGGMGLLLSIPASTYLAVVFLRESDAEHGHKH